MYARNLSPKEREKVVKPNGNVHTFVCRASKNTGLKRMKNCTSSSREHLKLSLAKNTKTSMLSRNMLMKMILQNCLVG